MLSRAQLEEFAAEGCPESFVVRRPEFAGLTGVHLAADGSMVLEFDLAEARILLATAVPVKEEESAPKALVALSQSASAALPTSPHAR
jgi:hypothetical protein